MTAELARLLHGTTERPPWGMLVEITASDPTRTLRQAKAAMISVCSTGSAGARLDASLDAEWVEILASEHRDWVWWSAEVVGSEQIDLIIALEGFPVSGFSALRALLSASGASEVRQTRR